MSAPSSETKTSAIRTAAAILFLSLVAWSAWKSIPSSRACFSDSEIARNRLLANQVHLLTVPEAVTGPHLWGETDLQLSPGGTIRYNIAQLPDLLHAFYQVSGRETATLEITAQAKGKSTLLFNRRLAPAERALDTLPYMLLCRLAELPPGTDQILLSVPASSSGSINWQRTGATSRLQFPALSEIPLELVTIDAYQLPGWDESASFVMLHAPSRLIFRIPSGRHHFSFNYGYNPAAFSDPKAESDGMELEVVSTGSTQSRQLLKRLLQPFSRATDRELQSATLELDSTESSLLEFIISAGPKDSIAWDWFVLQNIRLEPTNN